jgi:hypothetical protein
MKLAAALLALVATLAAAATPQPVLMPGDFEGKPAAQIETLLEGAHPASILIYAAKLWGSGKADESVKWYYIGQLRYRFYLEAVPQQEDGDPALYASLRQNIGEPINLYAGGDLARWRGQLRGALDWDAAHANTFLPKEKHATELAAARATLEKMIAYIDTNAKTLMEQREASGIGQVGFKDGVYIEERIQPMPKDWPPIATSTAPRDLCGRYNAQDDFVVTTALAGRDDRAFIRAKVIELSVPAVDVIRIAALDGDKVMDTRDLPVHQERGALIVGTPTQKPFADMIEGGVTERVLIRTNQAGDLVLERSSLTEGRKRAGSYPIRLSYTFWNRWTRASPDATCRAIGN